MPRMHTAAVPLTLTFAAAAAAIALPASVTHAQDAVQWRVKNGGNGHWYQFVFLPRECIEDSERRANELGASLATIHSDGENAFVDALIPPYNGNYSVGRLGAFQDDDAPSPDSGWNWITGEPWSYTAWSPYNNQPNDGVDENHVVIYASAHTGAFAGWHDNTDSCGDVVENLGWIIEWSADCNGDGIVDLGQILDGTLADENGNGVPDCCDEGFSCSTTPVQWRAKDGGNGHWYQRVPWTGDDLVAFNENLISHGAHLASVGSSSEQGFVSSLSTDLEYWTMLGGIRDVSIPCGQVSGWSWLDGTTFDFTSWDVGTCPQPDCSVSTAIAFGWDRNGCQPTTRWHDVPPEDVYIRFAIAEWSADCNEDGIVDYGQILDGTYPDENDNGVPDCCDAGIRCDCPADITGDGHVDAADLGVLLAVWNTDGGTIPETDINGDGTVNASDLGLLLGSWGLCS